MVRLLEGISSENELSRFFFEDHKKQARERKLLLKEKMNYLEVSKPKQIFFFC